MSWNLDVRVAERTNPNPALFLYLFHLHPFPAPFCPYSCFGPPLFCTTSLFHLNPCSASAPILPHPCYMPHMCYISLLYTHATTSALSLFPHHILFLCLFFPIPVLHPSYSAPVPALASVLPTYVLPLSLFCLQPCSAPSLWPVWTEQQLLDGVDYSTCRLDLEDLDVSINFDSSNKNVP